MSHYVHGPHYGYLTPPLGFQSYPRKRYKQDGLVTLYVDIYLHYYVEQP